MENKERYNHLNTYYKNKFGERTLKICIDAGFTCPNRDGTLSHSGCIFCSNKGSGELIKFSNLNITKQVQNFLNSYRGKRANKFIVYFQNFTNTYDSILNLKSKYDAALIDNGIIGLSVATRPDCINEDIANLLASYSDKYNVSVELGLQSSNDAIGNLINRCYSSAQFTNAVNILRKHNIEVIAHIMIGLPIALDYYLENLAYVITHLRPNIIIHRISGDAPKDLLVAPKWNLHKKWVLNGFEKLLKEQDLWQGKFYHNNE